MVSQREKLNYYKIIFNNFPLIFRHEASFQLCTLTISLRLSAWRDKFQCECISTSVSSSIKLKFESEFEKECFYCYGNSFVFQLWLIIRLRWLWKCHPMVIEIFMHLSNSFGDKCLRCGERPQNSGNRNLWLWHLHKIFFSRTRQFQI